MKEIWSILGSLTYKVNKSGANIDIWGTLHFISFKLVVQTISIYCFLFDEKLFIKFWLFLLMSYNSSFLSDIVGSTVLKAFRRAVIWLKSWFFKLLKIICKSDYHIMLKVFGKAWKQWYWSIISQFRTVTNLRNRSTLAIFKSLGKTSFSSENLNIAFKISYSSSKHFFKVLKLVLSYPGPSLIFKEKEISFNSFMESECYFQLEFTVFTLASNLVFCYGDFVS